jgi:hypothetical protein
LFLSQSQFVPSTSGKQTPLLHLSCHQNPK